jgi:nucleotide-binding universal stress UspA family protein
MSNSPTSILVPIDPTEPTTVALNQAYSLARHTQSKLILLAINRTENFYTLKKKLNALAEEAYEKSGCQVETLIRYGNMHEQIQKVADVFNSLLVLGFTSKLSLNSFIGRQAFKLACEYKNPVITIRGNASRVEYKTILLPIQLRKETREKVDKAVELAKRYDASIRIISVLTQSDEAAENKLLAYANQVWKHIKSQHIRCTLKTVRGKDPAQLILEYGHQVDADVILIMNKEPINVKEFFTGTVAQQLMSESDIPVMCYQPMERKDTSVFFPY